MANSKNIEPYATFAHRAAPYGGPEQYVEKAFEAGVKCGIKIGEKKGTKKGIVKGAGGLAVAGLAVYGIKKLINHIKKARQEKEEAKASLLKTMDIAIDKLGETLSDSEEEENNNQEERTDG